MSVALESGMLRSFLHRLVDGLVDDLEGKATSPARPPAPTSRPRITLAEKPEAMAAVEHRRPGRPPLGEVVVGCVRHNRATNKIRVAMSQALAAKIGLGPKFPCPCKVMLAERGLLLGPGAGARASRAPTGSRVLIYFGPKAGFAVAHEHPSEACAHHVDPEGRLAIRAPAWLKRTTPAAPPAKPTGQKGKGDPSVSCTKVVDKGQGPVLRCAECGRAATVECSRCQKLLCDACWDPHVRTHWHVDGKATTYRGPAREHAHA